MPLFITTGEKVKVDTRDGSYLGRVTATLMGARTKARKRALDILFESELRGLPVAETLTARQEASRGSAEPLHGHPGRGRRRHRAEIDEAITAYSAGWPLDRMPAVDRTILRIGVFELRHVDEVPDAVALSRGGGAGARAVDRRVAVRSSTACWPRSPVNRPTTD